MKLADSTSTTPTPSAVQFPSAEDFVGRMFECAGGKDAFFALAAAEVAQVNERWNQNVEVIGRILRAHLFVEHYLTDHLVHANPGIGSIQKARLSFAQKLELLNSDRRLTELVPGIRRLNEIRNRLAHQLNAGVTEDDAALFLSAPLFKAMRDAGARPGGPSKEPMTVLEDFAKYASNTLMSNHSELSKLIARALQAE